MTRNSMKYLLRAFIVVDAILVVVTLALAYYLRLESGFIHVQSVDLSFNEYMSPLYFLVPAELILYKFFQLYGSYRKRSFTDEVFNILKAKFISMLVFFGYLYGMQIIYYSRWVVIFYFIIGIALSVSERLVIRHILRKARKNNKNPKTIVLIGYSNLAIEYAKRIYKNSHWGYKIIGVFDNKSKRNYIHLHKQSVKVLGNLDSLGDYIDNNIVDEVVITLALKDYSLLEEVVELCEKHGVFTRIIPDYYKLIPAKPEVEEIDGLPVIGIRKIPLNDGMNAIFKRVFDVTAALLGTIVFSPVLLVVVLMIKLGSKGPLIYKQTRVGLNRSEFEMYKFRSMRVQTSAEEKKAWTTKNDPRVTSIGKFIRRTSIDELPQLINILKGDMSLIGPRPERPQFVDKYKEVIPKYMVKHQVRPGMTGWAQVNGWRGDTSIEKRIEYDLYYIENWSVRMEVQIFFMTFWKGFINKNAY